MKNGTIGEVKSGEETGNNAVKTGCGLLSLLAIINLIFCTPLYLMAIAWFMARAYGE